MNNETKLVFEQLGKALIRLQEVVSETPTQKRIIIDATIKRFEFSIELYWKALKKLLIELGREPEYPKQVLQLAYAGKLIDNENFWINMLVDRNRTSHIYKEEMADEIYARIKTYVPEMQKTYEQLMKKFS